jgi:putative membrane protein
LDGFVFVSGNATLLEFGVVYKVKYLWLLVFFATLIWSGISPKDQFTWLLEAAPALLAIVALTITYNSFRLTPLLYFLILLHCIVLMVGGHYTYAEVPLFNYIQPIFGFERNNYDKLGHFVQGFVPAMIAREILIRKAIMVSRAWRNFFIVCFALAFSAFYELLEWLVAISTGDSAEAFLGTQGYVWDTQTDMFAALIGAICALLLLGKLHDKQLAKLK